MTPLRRLARSSCESQPGMVTNHVKAQHPVDGSLGPTPALLLAEKNSYHTDSKIVCSIWVCARQLDLSRG